MTSIIVELRLENGTVVRRTEVEFETIADVGVIVSDGIPFVYKSMPKFATTAVFTPAKSINWEDLK